MPISATLSISSGVTGTLLSVEFQQLGRVEIKLSQKPRKHCIYGHRFPSYKCFWQVPRSRKLKNFKPRELPLHFAYGKDAEDRSLSNLSEDTDEMFDELFKKYGKVVFRRNDQKLPSAEVDDDVESLSCDVVIHIFLPDQRAFYNLEEFYGNATPIELPFEKQPPLQS